MTIPSYSETDNTSIIVDGMLPSQVLTIFRMILADQRLQWNDAEWFEYRDGTPEGTVTYTANNQVSVSGADSTAHYHVGRRVKVVGGSQTVYATITAVADAGANTLITIDNSSLVNEPITLYSSILSNQSDALPREAIQDIIGDMLSNNTTSAIDVTYQDSDGTIDFEVTAQATENNYSDADKTKLDGIATSANNYSHPAENHIPGSGGTGQLLRYASAGTATWWTPNYVPNSGNSSISGIKTFTTTTESTNRDTGCVVLEGGLGVQKNIHAGGDVTAFNTSDKRKKKDIKVIPDALGKIDQIGGYSFNFINPEHDGQKGKQYGVIAQELQSVLPEIVVEKEDGTLTLKKGGFELTALLIEAVKELSARVDSLEGK